jgi:hypothetical protein
MKHFDELTEGLELDLKPGAVFVIEVARVG